MAKYSVKVREWREEKDAKLKPVRVAETKTIAIDLSWEEAKKLKRETHGSEIFPMA